MTTTLIVLEAVVLLLLLVLVVGLLRSHGEILRALDQLGLDPAEPGAAPRIGVTPPKRDGSAAPDIAGIAPDGADRVVAVAAGRTPTLLAFMSSGCLTCAGFWDAFRRPDSLDLPGEGTRLVVVTKGPDQESRARVSELAPRAFTTVMSSEAWDAYQVPVSPYFVFVEAGSGRIAGEGAAATWQQLGSLMRQALADGGGRGSATRDRAERVDEILADSGIGPGHPSLHEEPGGEPRP